MVCKQCGYTGSKVVDKRNNNDNNTIRRRRECLSCGNRFTTYERVENSGLLVRKKSKRIEDYDRQKLKASILKGLKKRHINEDTVDRFIDQIEIKLASRKGSVVESSEIGKAVLDGLKEIDPVAYMLYATVYRDFATLEELETEINKLKIKNDQK